MKKTETGEVRDGGADIKWLTASICLFVILSVFSWIRGETWNTDFTVFFASFLGILHFFTAYMILRRRNWRIILSENTVTIRSSFGRERRFPRDDVRWRILIPWGARKFHVVLYDYSTKKQLSRVPADRNNVRLLFELHHFGPMTPEEKSASNYLRSGQA